MLNLCHPPDPGTCTGIFSGGHYFIKVPAQDGDDAQATSAAVKQVHNSLLRQLAYPDRVPGGDGAGSSVALTQLFSNELRDRTHLLVLDGVWSNSLLDQLLISNMRGVVLITARSRILVSPEVLTLTLSAAVEQRRAAEQLIRTILGDAAASENEVGPAPSERVSHTPSGLLGQISPPPS